jgi:hypothetical protein
MRARSTNAIKIPTVVIKLHTAVVKLPTATIKLCTVIVKLPTATVKLHTAVVVAYHCGEVSYLLFKICYSCCEGISASHIH